jgi:hypothetical protein
MTPRGDANVSDDFRWRIQRIPIRIKADVIDSVALAALFESPRCSWGINDAMPMQDDYRASVTTREEQTSG